FVNIPGPNRGGEAVRRVVGDANGFGFSVERDDGSDWAKDLLAGDARGVFYVVEDRWLDIVALAELLGAAPTDGYLGFFLADFEIARNTVVLLLADKRAHLGITFERSPELDALGFFRHRFNKLRVNPFLHEDAAAGGADFALIDEHAEKCAVNGGFPVCVW